MLDENAYRYIYIQQLFQHSFNWQKTRIFQFLLTTLNPHKARKMFFCYRNIIKTFHLLFFFNCSKSTSIYLLRFTSKFIILSFLANENVCIKLHYIFEKYYHYTDVAVISKHIQCGLLCIFTYIHLRILSRSAKCFCSQQNFEVICVKNVSSCLFMVFEYLLKLLYFTTNRTARH